MTNITISEWADHVTAIARQLGKAATFTTVTVEFGSNDEPNGVRIEGLGRVMTASLDLRNTRVDEGFYMTSSIRIGSSACFPGDLISARSQLIAVTEVLDLATVADAQVQHLKIWPDGTWPDGTCPCDHCSGRGETQGSPCKTCKGKGVR